MTRARRLLFFFPQLIYPAVLSFLLDPTATAAAATTRVDCFELSGTVTISGFSNHLGPVFFCFFFMGLRRSQKNADGFSEAVLHPNPEFSELRNYPHNGPEMGARSNQGTNCPRSAHGIETNCPLSAHEMEAKCPLSDRLQLSSGFGKTTTTLIRFWKDDYKSHQVLERRLTLSQSPLLSCGFGIR